MPGRDHLWRGGLHQGEDQRIGKSEQRYFDDPRVHKPLTGADRRVVAKALRLRNHSTVDELLSKRRKSWNADGLGEYE